MFKETLSELEKRYRDLLAEMEDRLSSELEGSLDIKKSKGRIQYRHKWIDPETGERKRDYLLKDDPKVKELAQWQYDKKAYRYVKARLREIGVLNRNYEEDALLDMYEELSKERRELVEPAVKRPEDIIQEWMDIPYVRLGFKPGDLEIYTARKERVRSKSEKILADLFAGYGLYYKYECPLQLGNGRIVYPDFTFFNPRRMCEIYWEHHGLMTDPTTI